MNVIGLVNTSNWIEKKRRLIFHSNEVFHLFLDLCK